MIIKKLPFFVATLFGSGITMAQQKAAKLEYIEVGTQLSTYPKVEWVKGAPVTGFEKDKIYIIELWATWCVPCVAAMPHLNALHNQFKDKNVVFIAQDIMEDDKKKVEQFVAKKGGNLSYKVAFSGAEGSDFDKNWVKPAGVSTIPQTFVIQNNTLVWITTPDQLNEEVIQLLIDGKFKHP